MNKSLLALCLGASFLLNGIVFIRLFPKNNNPFTNKLVLDKPINLKLLESANFNQLLNSSHLKDKQSLKQKTLAGLGRKIRQQKIQEPSLKKLLNTFKSPKKLTNASLIQEEFPIKHKSFVSIQNSKNENLKRDKHFSFYQRILEDYINKLNANFINQNPTISKELAGEELIGRIIFDIKGNAQTLKILKWSRNNEFQEFFLHSLKEIRNIPNPPKELISTNEDFTVTYGLKVIL